MKKIYIYKNDYERMNFANKKLVYLITNLLRFNYEIVIAGYII